MRITNEDCMDLMARYKDKHFDLAIVDPPYGIGEDGKKNHNRGKLAKTKKYKDKDWDKKPPSKQYFKELKRVSKNQIIWGSNHFIDRVPYGSSCWIVWNKDNGANDFSDCELAYTSFKTGVRMFTWRWNGMLQGDMKNKEKRIHPTQKPVKLYEWLLINYAKKGDKILDTHGGSMSIAIAVHNVNVRERMELTLDVCEIDKDYYNEALKRYKNHISQTIINF